MNFNPHFDLAGKHAFLSASKYYWLNYTPEKLESVYANEKKKEEGTALHAFAEMAIKKRIKLAPHKKTLNMFVNDCIGFGMTSEQVLYYSDNCFGTADAIRLVEVEGELTLRIFDYKSGVSRVSFRQIDIYCALFCLEYGYQPKDLLFHQRIYQSNNILEQWAEPEDIEFVMGKIVEFDKLVSAFKSNV